MLQAAALGAAASPSPAAGDGAIAVCDTAAGLSAINAPEAQLVIWRRDLPAALTRGLEDLHPDSLPHTRLLVRPADLRAALAPDLDAAQMPTGPTRDHLLEDIGGLVTLFARVTERGLVDVRLERLDHDACWKFHRDRVKARLLTTYRGPATEWVHPDFAQRAVRDQKSYDGPLERMGQHDVAIFKGDRAGPDRGIVHRSPPVEGTGRTRLLLVLNERSAVSPDPWGLSGR